MEVLLLCKMTILPIHLEPKRTIYIKDIPLDDHLNESNSRLFSSLNEITEHIPDSTRLWFIKEIYKSHNPSVSFNR